MYKNKNKYAPLLKKYYMAIAIILCKRTKMLTVTRTLLANSQKLLNRFQSSFQKVMYKNNFIFLNK